MDNRELIDKTFDEMLKDAASDAEDMIVEELLSGFDENEIIEFSEEHKEKMQKIFKAERKKELYKNLFSYSKRVAVFFGAVIVISGILVLSVDAWRTGFFNFIIEIHDNYTAIEFSDVTNENVIANTYASEYILLEYIPDGFILERSTMYGTMLSLKFVKSENNFSLLRSAISAKMQIDTENATTKNISINGKEAFYSTNDNVNILVWHDNIFAYILSGNIEENEFILIAENIISKK